jgi:ABC-type uncharacterized transport system auxiliary subunit
VKPLFILLIAGFLLLGGCLTKVDRRVTNYYVLDYKKATENPSLRIPEAYPKTLEVLDTDVNRTYSRNQIVIRENYSKVRYMSYDLWANRLSDAVPNLIVQRLRAYNLFRQVDRSTGEFNPDYYLETSLLNLEKISSENPRAYLRMEFYLRDSRDQRILITYKAERFKDLVDDSMVFLIQSYNEMLMQETDIFAARCRMFLEGKPAQEKTFPREVSPVERFIEEQASESATMVFDGELLLKLTTKHAPEIRYTVELMDAANNPVSSTEGEFNKELSLAPGRYRITIGENQEIPIYAEIKPKLRTVIQGEWSELVVRIIDESQNRIRMTYDMWIQNTDEDDFYLYGRDTSLGDDDLGQPDKIWILAPGTYMIKLGGGSWNDRRDFATINLTKGDNQLMTVVVNPTGEGNFLVGAGVLGGEEEVLGRPVVHRGAVHANISLSSNNNVDKNEPTFSVNLAGQLENNLDVMVPLTRYTARSIYDVGMNMATDSDLRINSDSYSLKNVLLLTPWESSKTFRNFSIYGRADLYTHYFDESIYFSSQKNLITLSASGDTLDLITDQDRVRTKVAFFPLRLKEGSGITYRLVFSPKVSLSLRGGYGWQQEMNNRSFYADGSGASQVPGDTLVYDYYREYASQQNHGIESTLVFTALNMLNFLSVNSTFDVLFPMNETNRRVRFDSENRFNIRLYRNISLDVKVNLQYDTSQKDWIVYDTSSYLRLSLYY